MVFGINKDEAQSILAIFIAILFFQSIPRFPLIGEYLNRYPYIVFGIGIILLAKSKDIIRVLYK